MGITVHLHAQKEFNPNERIEELTGKKENIGIPAGYSIDGKMKLTKSGGFICENSEIPFSWQTITRIASIAKNFTAVAIMQLVEKGKLKLDSPMEKYILNLPEDKSI